MSRAPFVRLFVCLAFPAALAAQQAFGPAAGCFGGSGGPGGDFDLVVRSGQVLFLDTLQATVVGGPDGQPTQFQQVVNGVLDVRHLTIEEAAEIRAVGPNPLRIQATGDVTIRGVLDLGGFSGHDVATLNTGNITEPGGPGGPGGGRGGDSNVVTTNSSPRGGSGRGAFGAPDAGGRGGESGYAPSGNKNARRPGGGGGGRFAAGAQPQVPSPPGLGTSATAGTDGSPMSTGAETGESPARGGEAGPGPFVDGSDRNDFLGHRPVVVAGRIATLRGELPVLWAGSGGGGGGNAAPAAGFPTPGWNIGSDEKGGPGGGAGGALHVQALGRIVFGAAGTIRSNGARGGTGENTNFLDHIGGTGGSGSGGHVVLESATQIDFTDGGTNQDSLPRGWVEALGPLGHSGPVQFVDACCRGYSNGGAGGPGVVQLHVPDPLRPPSASPTAGIRLPARIAHSRRPLEGVAFPAPIVAFLTCQPIAGRLAAGRPALAADGGPELVWPRDAEAAGLEEFELLDALEVPIRR